jgi:hypothetical protein
VTVTGEGQAAPEPALLLFGGKDHDVFLGCANCSKNDASSICNTYGKFGSRYQSDSIWNQYGTYGSHYQSGSPWNKYAPPSVAIVDKDGNFYGYLTANKYAAKRTSISPLNRLAEAASASDDLPALRDLYCGDE